MAACEDEAQSIIGILVFHSCFSRMEIAEHARTLKLVFEFGLLVSLCFLTPDGVEQFPVGHRSQPGSRIPRDSFGGPSRGRKGERFLERLLGQIKRAGDADQSRNDPPVLLSKDPVECCVRRVHGGYGSVCAIRSTSGRTSMVPARADGMRLAISTASLRLAASIRK